MVSTFCEYFCFRMSFSSYSISVWTVSASFCCLLNRPQYRMKVQFTFPFRMHGHLLHSSPFTTKKAKNWCFELWCWRRLLRVPWTARRSNQSILKDISLEYSLEGLMLKLKLRYFGHLMGRTDLYEKTLVLGKTEGGEEGDDREWDGSMALPTQWTWVWVNSRSWGWTGGRPGVLQSMGLQKSARLTDWTELNHLFKIWNVDTQNIFGFLIER